MSCELTDGKVLLGCVIEASYTAEGTQILYQKLINETVGYYYDTVKRTGSVEISSIFDR